MNVSTSIEYSKIYFVSPVSLLLLFNILSTMLPFRFLFKKVIVIDVLANKAISRCDSFETLLLREAKTNSWYLKKSTKKAIFPFFLSYERLSFVFSKSIDR